MENKSALMKFWQVMDYHFPGQTPQNIPLNSVQMAFAEKLVRQVCEIAQARVSPSEPPLFQNGFDAAVAKEALSRFCKKDASIGEGEKTVLYMAHNLLGKHQRTLRQLEIQQACAEICGSVTDIYMTIDTASHLQETPRDLMDPGVTKRTFAARFPLYSPEANHEEYKGTEGTAHGILGRITTDDKKTYLPPLDAAASIAENTGWRDFCWTGLSLSPSHDLELARGFAAVLIERCLAETPADKEKLWPIVQCMGEICGRDEMIAPHLRRLVPDIRARFWIGPA